MSLSDFAFSFGFCISPFHFAFSFRPFSIIFTLPRSQVRLSAHCSVRRPFWFVRFLIRPAEEPLKCAPPRASPSPRNPCRKLLPSLPRRREAARKGARNTAQGRPSGTPRPTRPRVASSPALLRKPPVPLPPSPRRLETQSPTPCQTQIFRFYGLVMFLLPCYYLLGWLLGDNLAFDGF